MDAVAVATNGDEAAPALFDLLPDDLLLRVLSRLCLDEQLRVAILARRWRGLVGGSLFSALSFAAIPNAGARVGARALARLCASAGGALRSLDASPLFVSVPALLDALLPCPGLASLALPRLGFWLSLADVRQLLGRCPRLASVAATVSAPAADAALALALLPAAGRVEVHEASRGAPGPGGVALLCAALAAAPAGRCVAALNLSHSGLGDAEAALVAAALARPGCAVASLHLHHNRVGDAGAVALAAALGRNASLRVLSLDDNALSRAGAAALDAAARAREPPLRLSVRGVPGWGGGQGHDE